MTVKEAAIQVLKTEAKPLHTKVLTDLILSRGLWNTQGQTPAATVEASIASDIKHNPTSSPFVRVSPRTCGHWVRLMQRIAEKLGFQMGTLVEVRQRNDNQWPNSCFCYYCG